MAHKTHYRSSDAFWQQIQPRNTARRNLCRFDRGCRAATASTALPQHHEMVKTLLLDRLHESLRVLVQVRLSWLFTLLAETIAFSNRSNCFVNFVSQSWIRFVASKSIFSTFIVKLRACWPPPDYWMRRGGAHDG